MKTRRTFSDAFKKEKVKLLETGKITVGELSALYEVSRTSIYRWLGKYGSDTTESIVVQKKSEASKNFELLKQIGSLEQLIGKMQVQLHYFESIIECGSELLGEDLKKKYASLQSPKP